MTMEHEKLTQLYDRLQADADASLPIRRRLKARRCPSG
jgi:hypothetical protein